MFCSRSVARAGHGASAVGLLMTGMGEDGAEGLGVLKAAGALTHRPGRGFFDCFRYAARRLLSVGMPCAWFPWMLYRIL